MNIFDTSNYSITNNYNIPLQNKGVLGLLKDENCGRIMVEFVGLRAKMYANRLINDYVTKRAKGVKKSVVKHNINFDDYKLCLYDNKHLHVTQILFKSDCHTIFTIHQNKLALSPSDSKRYINEDKITTLAWGHFSIPKNN